jgi:transcription elongation factor GreA
VPEQLAIIARLREELATMRRELSKDLPKQLEEARAHGDISENAEYEAAKERQGILTARIAQLERRIGELSRYSVTSIPTDRAGYGSLIEVEDLTSGDRSTYELVFPEEAEPTAGHVSISSPIGQALLNRREGDEVRVQTPSGQRSLEVISLTTIHARKEDR